MHCPRVDASIPPPGRRQHCRRCPSGAIPYQTLTLTRTTSGSSDGLACNERHAPGVVADIVQGARGGEAEFREPFLDFVLAVALQADTRAQFAIIRQRSR